MSLLPTQCPSCRGSLQVTKLACPDCSMLLEGTFDLHALLRLPPADLAFVFEFVRASGSLKEMARLHGQSYPTIRNRLNDIIAQLNAASDAAEQQRCEILDAIAQGAITVAEAARRLKEVKA